MREVPFGNGGMNMTYVVITVAGLSSRFNHGEEDDVLKCIHYNDNPKKTLLYGILQKCHGCREAIIVGGYKYQKLKEYTESQRKEFSFGIEVVYNEHYQIYGSGYSLKIGIRECLKKKDCTDIVFIEGDLVFDSQTLENIFCEKKSCLTVNQDVISSDKSVAVYRNRQEEFKFLYDACHGFFQIGEPFSVIYNSGQVWKFADCEAVKQIMGRVADEDWHGTNLKFIETYFNAIPKDCIQIFKFNKWINCNTRADYLLCEKDL